MANKSKFRGIPSFKRDYAKVGRNDLCPCQSGLKFKQCCMARALGLPQKAKTAGAKSDPVVEAMFDKAAAMKHFYK